MLNLAVPLSVILTLAGCSSKRLTEFQLYDGNETLPPEDQRVETIRGAISGNKIDIHFSRQKGQAKSEGNIVISGAQYETYSKMIGSTKLKGFQPLMGGDSFDVTLYYSDGKSVNGEPSNIEEWRQFESFIEQEIARSKKTIK